MERGAADTQRTDWLSPSSGNGRIGGQVTFRKIDGSYEFRALAHNRSGRKSPWSASSTIRVVMPDPGGSGTGGNGGNGGKHPGTGGPVQPP